MCILALCCKFFTATLRSYPRTHPKHEPFPGNSCCCCSAIPHPRYRLLQQLQFLGQNFQPKSHSSRAHGSLCLSCNDKINKWKPVWFCIAVLCRQSTKHLQSFLNLLLIPDLKLSILRAFMQQRGAVKCWISQLRRINARSNISKNIL